MHRHRRRGHAGAALRIGSGVGFGCHVSKSATGPYDDVSTVPVARGQPALTSRAKAASASWPACAMQRSRCDAGEQNRKARLALRAAVSPTLPAGVNAVFLEVDPWSYKAYLCGSEVEQLLASLCASGAAVLLLRTPGHFASSRWGFEENALNTDGALARCFKEAGTLARRAPPQGVRAKDGNVVRARLQPYACLRSSHRRLALRWLKLGSDSTFQLSTLRSMLRCKQSTRTSRWLRAASLWPCRRQP